MCAIWVILSGREFGSTWLGLVWCFIEESLSIIVFFMNVIVISVNVNVNVHVGLGLGLHSESRQCPVANR